MAILLSLRDGLAPFVALQYPAPALEHPDSFPDSSYYNVGKLDLCMVLTIIVVMTVLRDASMRGIFAPYARWILTRNSKARPMPMKSLQNGVFSNTNGHSKVNGYYANGHGSANHRKEARRLNRSVLRFAEQGWSVVYYSLQWCFGVVSLLLR
jgi:acyl-CoA-dependent ceramide synthase